MSGNKVVIVKVDNLELLNYNQKEDLKQQFEKAFDGKKILLISKHISNITLVENDMYGNTDYVTVLKDEKEHKEEQGHFEDNDYIITVGLSQEQKDALYDIRFTEFFSLYDLLTGLDGGNQ